MSAVALACPRRPVNPAPILALLGVIALGCAVAVVALIVAAPSAALFTVSVLALGGWLVHLATTVPLPWLLGGAVLAVLVVVWPCLLLVAVVSCLVLTRGGPQ